MDFKMSLKNTLSCSFVCALLLIMAVNTKSLAISNSKSSIVQESSTILGGRQAKTLDMTNGMNMVKDMLQNGIPLRPSPVPFFSNIKNLFRTNGTYVTWVPLGSLLFGNNGKIIGGR